MADDKYKIAIPDLDIPGISVLEADAEKLKTALDKMATYSTKFQKIIWQHNQQINALLANGYNAEAEVARRACEKALSETADKMLKDSGLWEQMTSQLSNLSLRQLAGTYKDAKQLLDFVDGKATELPAGMNPELYRNLDENSETVAKLRTEVGKLHQEFAKKGSVQAFCADIREGFVLINDGFGKMGEGGMTQVLQGIGVIQAGWGTVRDQVKQIGKDMASICDDENISYIIENTTQMVDAGLKGLTGLGQMLTGDILGGAVSIISSVASFFSIGQKVKAENEKLRKEIHDHELKSYLAEFEINKLYRERYEWAKRIDESTLQYLARKGKVMTDQITQNENEQNQLREKLYGTEYVAGERYKHGTWFRKGKIIKDMASLEGKTDTEIDLLARQGKLSEDGKKYYDALKAAREEGEKLAQSQKEYLEKVRETFTGSSYDQVVTSIIDGFKAGKKSAADFADTFQSLMKNAVTQSLKLMADEKVRAWYEKFAQAAESDGELTADEQEQLRQEWNDLMAQLSNEEARLRAVTGIDVTTAKKEDKQASGLRGEITEKITENTASKLEGLFRYSVDIQSRIASLGAEQLAAAQSSLVQVADIARSGIAIEENTRRTADNTDGLRERLDTVATELRAIKNNTAGGEVWAK